jgi:hypothetical protein
MDLPKTSVNENFDSWGLPELIEGDAFFLPKPADLENLGKGWANCLLLIKTQKGELTSTHLMTLD